MITLQLSEASARKLRAYCERTVAQIGQALATKGSAAISKALTELREASEILSALEAAGVHPPSAPASASQPALPSQMPAATHPPATDAAPDDAPIEEGDDAPPAAVVAARKSQRPPAAPKFQRGYSDRDSFSGP